MDEREELQMLRRLAELEAKAGGSRAQMSKAERFGMGLADPIHGAAQMLTQALPESVVSAGNRVNNWLAEKTGLVAPLPAGGVDQQVREREAAYKAQRGDEGIDWMRIAGNVASPVNLAMAAAAPAAAATTGGRIAAGIGMGAASGAMTPVTEGDFASEKRNQVALGGVTGGVVPAVAAGVSRVVNPVAASNPQLAMLRNAGVQPTIGQSLGGRVNVLEEKMTSVPILGDMIAGARGRAMEQFNNAAINRATAPIGVQIKGTGNDAIRKAGDALSQAYDDVLSNIKSVQFDQNAGQQIQQLHGMAQNMVPEMRNKFNAILQNIVGTRVSPAGGMTAETFKKLDSEIGQLASRYGKSVIASEGELGDALRQMQAIMRDQVARSNPAYADRLGKINEGWANLVRLERAANVSMKGGGEFTPAQLLSGIKAADDSVRKRAVSRGNALMQDLGSAGEAVLGNRVPDSGTPDRMFANLAAVASGAINPALPLGLAAGGSLYAPGVSNALARLATQRPDLAEPIANALRASSPALVPAAAQLGVGLNQR